MEYFQHSAIYPHPEHLTCYTVIVCYDIPLDLQRVVKRFHKTLRERSRVQIGLLLDRESRLVLVGRHCLNYRKHMRGGGVGGGKVSRQARLSSRKVGELCFVVAERPAHVVLVGYQPGAPRDGCAALTQLLCTSRPGPGDHRRVLSLDQ